MFSNFILQLKLSLFWPDFWRWPLWTSSGTVRCSWLRLPPENHCVHLFSPHTQQHQVESLNIYAAASITCPWIQIRLLCVCISVSHVIHAMPHFLYIPVHIFHSDLVQLCKVHIHLWKHNLCKRRNFFSFPPTLLHKKVVCNSFWCININNKYQ